MDNKNKWNLLLVVFVILFFAVAIYALWIYFAQKPLAKNQNKDLAGNAKLSDQKKSVSENSDFINNNDGTVSGIKTGLQWKVCPGADLASENCSATDSGLSFEEAILFCDSLDFAGHSDWRLPDVHELLTIVDFKKSNPAINTNFFAINAATLDPNKKYGSEQEYYADYFKKLVARTFWTSDSNADPKESDGAWGAWIVDFNSGMVGAMQKSTPLNFRCVRGKQSDAELSMIDNGDGTVIDHGNGLQWKKCSNGSESGTDCPWDHKDYNWEGAIALCDSLDFAGHTDWRLPSVAELSTIIDYNKFDPSINKALFPDTHGNDSTGNVYWASDPVADQPAGKSAWAAYFHYGVIGIYNNDGHNDGDGFSVRCVRSGK
ncbi:MAG: DUF1566 domain-containing protein [Candidatus Paceibacterota bacterium]